MGEEQSDYFARRFTDDPTELFRIFRYPEHTFADEADEWGVREHTDYGFLTILLQDDSGGLVGKTNHVFVVICC
jgi:isopenicillin N synthase-like dioxygenase